MARTGHETCHHRGYMLSCEEYEDLRGRADGKCEICRTPAEGTVRGFLVIDHDHYHYDLNNAVRGLVCDKCNQHLRLVQAGKRPMDNATLAYLREPWFRRYEEARRTGQRRFRGGDPGLRLYRNIPPLGNCSRHDEHGLPVYA